MKRKILLILLVMMPLMLISCQNRQNRITEKVVSAIQNGDTERAKELIMTDGYDVNTPTFHESKLGVMFEIVPTNALITACKEGNAEIVSLLLERGAKTSPKDNIGVSPLVETMRYFQEDDPAIVKMLVEAGADVNEPDGTMLEPIMICASNFPEEYNRDRSPVYSGIYDEKIAKAITSMVGYLVENGANTVDDIGITVLHRAAEANNIELIKYSVEVLGVSVNYKNIHGQTPLFYIYGNSEYCDKTVELLIDYGADLSVVDDSGKTAYDRAVELGYERLAELLKPIETQAA